MQPQNINFRAVTAESERYITVREQGDAGNTVVIIDMANPSSPIRRQISADSALMCLDKKVIALKAATPGVVGDNLQVFNLDTKTKLKAHQMPEAVEYWKWVSPTLLGLVTAGAVYHWDIEVGVLGQWGGRGGRGRGPCGRARAARAPHAPPTHTPRTRLPPPAGRQRRPRQGVRSHAQPGRRPDYQLPGHCRPEVERADWHHRGGT